MNLTIAGETPSHESRLRFGAFVVDEFCKIVPVLFNVELQSEEAAAMPDIERAIHAKAGSIYFLPSLSDPSGTRIATPVEMSSYPKPGSTWSEWATSQLTLEVYKELGERGHSWSVKATQVIAQADEITIGIDGRVMIFGIELFDAEHYVPSCGTCIAGRTNLQFDLEQINNALILTPSNKEGYMQFGGKQIQPHLDQKLVFIPAGAADYAGLWAQFQEYYRDRVHGLLEISSIREMRLHLRT